MASIQRVASTFFRAIDEQQGTPYVFRADRKPGSETNEVQDEPLDLPSEDSDQEELDRFIAEIEEAADQENSANWSEEDSAEDRGHGRYRSGGDRRRSMDIRKWDGGDEISEGSESEELESGDGGGSGDDNSVDEIPRRMGSARPREGKVGRGEGYKARGGGGSRAITSDRSDDGSDGDELGGMNDGFWESDDDRGDVRSAVSERNDVYNYLSSGDEDDGDEWSHGNMRGELKNKKIDERWDSD
uniref:Uncharacterized protein n=1 Tax=Ananas comosus var. bracteatus TaxID=296719 RepID=A0A6V7PFZ3_ANACO|nr:unnamed protein product [Ananas comosus var. bracteatus]